VTDARRLASKDSASERLRQTEASPGPKHRRLRMIPSKSRVPGIIAGLIVIWLRSCVCPHEEQLLERWEGINIYKSIVAIGFIIMYTQHKVSGALIDHQEWKYTAMW